MREIPYHHEPAFLGGLSDADLHAFYALLYRFVSGLLAERLDACTRRLAQCEEELGRLRGRRYKL